MPDPLDALDLADGKRLAIVADHDGLAAVPMLREPDGGWRRAQSGDGAAEALLGLLARTSDAVTHGRFTVQSWTQLTALGETMIGVDQTNESVIVGGAAVVKWGPIFRTDHTRPRDGSGYCATPASAACPARGVWSRGSLQTARRLWWRASTSSSPMLRTAGHGPSI